MQTGEAVPSARPCLLLLLQPVRGCLHPFLSAADAARLMQASRFTAVTLLSGYAFVDRVFAYEHDTVDDVKRSLAFYARYHIRILRMCLPADWDEPLIDQETGQSLLPASLVALTIGQSRGLSVAHAAFDDSGSEQEGENGEKEEHTDEEADFYRRVRPVDTDGHDEGTAWDVLQFGACDGRFNLPIPPGALPSGLRFLQFGTHFNQKLQVGSIPDSVQVLQFGECFNQAVRIAHLPASLTHLVLGHFSYPLRPGMLPAGLRRLHSGIGQMVLPGALPAQLQHLSLGVMFDQSLDNTLIPLSVTHLRFGVRFNQPLQLGSIPHALVHLNLGFYFDHPLLPGVLPTSLRELVLSVSFNQPLQPGSLPDGLNVLAFSVSYNNQSKFQQQLQPGVIPTSVTVVSMGKQYGAALVAGGVPSSVRWLRLPASFAGEDLSGVLSPSTRVVTWPS